MSLDKHFVEESATVRTLEGASTVLIKYKTANRSNYNKSQIQTNHYSFVTSCKALFSSSEHSRMDVIT